MILANAPNVLFGVAAQIIWEDNRQAIHDRIAVTAVIRDQGGRES